MTALLENANHELPSPGIQFLTRTGEAHAGLAFQADTGQVITGGGLDLEAWAAMIREVLQATERATVHTGDQMAGPGVPAVSQGRDCRARRPRAPALTNAILRGVPELDKGPEQ